MTFSQTITVTENQTAEKLGSGLLPVFSTPSLIAFMENTAMKMIEIPEGKSSVGTLINVEHQKASLVGAVLTCTAETMAVEGRKYVFSVRVTDEKGDIVGRGTHERFVVDVEKFMSKIQ